MKQKAEKIQKTARFFLKPHHPAENSPLPPSPAVILLRHSDLRGPVNAFLSLEPPPRLWVLFPFFNRKDCYEHYRRYTFAERRGKKPRRFSLKAATAATVVVPLIRSLGAVPVYRGKSNIKETLEQSTELLKQGETIVIAADKDYSDTESPVSSIYTGFFRLEHSYFDATGEHLPFCALRFEKNRAMTFSEPMYFTGNQPFHRERKQMAKTILDFLNNKTGS
ncbi:MAG: hypothetical protein ACI3W6_09615 [Clostridia bacterium]